MPTVKQITGLKELPKLMFFSAIDTTLQPLFDSLNWYRVLNPETGSALFIEFYTESSDSTALRVRIFYKR